MQNTENSICTVRVGLTKTILTGYICRQTIFIFSESFQHTYTMMEISRVAKERGCYGNS